MRPVLQLEGVVGFRDVLFGQFVVYVLPLISRQRRRSQCFD